jgi:hypothetical protein
MTLDPTHIHARLAVCTSATPQLSAQGQNGNTSMVYHAWCMGMIVMLGGSARPLAAPDAVDGGACDSDVPYRLSPFAMLAATPKPQPEEVAVSPL